MTTIAFKSGIVACDSRMTSGSRIETDEFDKHIVRDGIHFWGAGEPACIDEMIDVVLGKLTELIIDKNDSILFMYSPKENQMYDCYVRNSGIVKTKFDYECSIGSGSSYAIAFMDTGVSASRAIELTSKRDIYTGGKVQEFVLEDLK